MLRIAVASKSAVKIAVCANVFGTSATIIPCKASSGVPEQPFDDETLCGAINRLVEARQVIPDANYYVSIENGLFVENARYIDKAVVAMESQDKRRIIVVSDGVEFPANTVDEARRRGFDAWTVGRVMEEQGIVAQHDDPQLSLTGRSRVAYLEESLRKAAKTFGL